MSSTPFRRDLTEFSLGWLLWLSSAKCQYVSQLRHSPLVIFGACHKVPTAWFGRCTRDHRKSSCWMSKRCTPSSLTTEIGEVSDAHANQPACPPQMVNDHSMLGDRGWLHSRWHQSLRKFRHKLLSYNNTADYNVSLSHALPRWSKLS